MPNRTSGGIGELDGTSGGIFIVASGGTLKVKLRREAGSFHQMLGRGVFVSDKTTQLMGKYIKNYPADSAQPLGRKTTQHLGKRNIKNNPVK